MRMVLPDDDGSEWSIEILDGVHVNAPTKRVKQTPPTSTCSGSKPTSKAVHPFFSKEISTATKVAASGAQVNGQEAMEPSPDEHRPPPVFTGGSHHASYPILPTKNAKATGRIRPHPTIPTHGSSNEFSPDSHHLQHVQFQNDRPPHQPIPLTKNPSSSSSTQNSSGSKANKGEKSLPVYSFLEYINPPAVVYTKSESEANSLVQTLKGHLGFDLEWRVIWRPGAEERRTALVQLCDDETILLIQVSSMKRFPEKVWEVIESADILKFGANILNDGEKLYQDFGIRAKGLVELGVLAAKADIKFSSVYNREIVSLAKVVAMYVNRTLLKGKVRTSNWEADLTRPMVEYAANDCHCALMVYDRLQGIAAEAGNVLDASTCARHVDYRSLQLKDASLPTKPAQRSDASAKSSVPNYCIREPPRPQQLRAYKLWHTDNMPLDQMCVKLRLGDRVEPLKESTVISYVVGALQADPQLPFDMGRLKALVFMEIGSWQRHRQWIASRG